MLNAMSSQKSLSNMQKFLVLLFFLSFLFIHGSPEVLSSPYRYCSNNTFSPNSTYLSNLKTLFSLLSSNSSRGLYHKSSAPPAYADFQCRGDLNATACRDCVATATSNSSQQYCPLSVGAVLWFDECFLRYSNRSFFSVVMEQPSLILINGDAIEEDVHGFDQIVGSALNDTVANASSRKGDLKFATKEARFGNVTVYTLAQCTGDLSNSNCRKCLTNAVTNFPDCCSGKKGGRILFPSCTFRYELYPFYGGVSPSSVSIPPASAPAVPSPPESSSPPADSMSAPPPPSLSSSPSAPAPSTAAPPLLSGKRRATVAMAMGIVVAGYFL
ncbi:cysteine-rich receptor-like protein kinase 25 [Benincasa hispida]|uniref:cysteine-rich receptor-like protein kinase 25 n=1 Tax=Benincasa hispida TaxID=102211 RepID=UPI00190046D7|nr:cysteine-rich receptor-like protein kinase 25 [Benincasa hispida]